MVIVVDMKVFFILSTCLTTFSTCELVVDGNVDGNDNKEEKTRGWLTIGCITLVVIRM